MSNYFDYNATTPTDPRVLEAMTPYFSEHFHNPSSYYRRSSQVAYDLEQSRHQVAKLINAHSQEIFFTSGGTESDNLAILGAVSRLSGKGNHIITSSIEHPAVLNVCKMLEEKGYRVTYLPVDRTGVIDPAALEENIISETILVSVIYANNEIGTIQPVRELCEIAHRHGVLFHTDAVQAAGKLKVDVNELGVDMLSFSSHKIYGPKGIGALFKRDSVAIDPIMFGGSQEQGLRTGTENVPGIIGLGRAAELARTEGGDVLERIKPLRDRLQAELIGKIPELIINGDTENRLYNTLNISVKYIEGESILALLDHEEISLSSGSACSSKSQDPSPVLLALGLNPADARGSLRISLGKYNTDHDIDKLIDVLPGIVEKLRKISPLWKG